MLPPGRTAESMLSFPVDPGQLMGYVGAGPRGLSFLKAGFVPETFLPQGADPAVTAEHANPDTLRPLSFVPAPLR